MKYTKKIAITLIFFVVLLSTLTTFAYGQIYHPVGKSNVQVTATVGEFYLNVYGYIAPYATIELTSDGVFYQSTVADENGNFSFTNILIKKGFSGFCLYAVDFKRIGESTTCFNFPPAKGNITMRDLFLPPTLGLYRTEIDAGGELIAFGYSMPGATVTLHLSDGQVVTITADTTGYYEAHIKSIPAGAYHIFADAFWHGKHSLAPSKVLAFRSLSWWDQFLAFLARLWKNLVNLFTSIGLGPLWFGLPLLALITFLILKIWPEKFTFIYESRLLQWLPFAKPRKLLHHWWMQGVGY